ncbi:MAG: tail fiber domain-containing protein, partial [Ignavibacteriaceae bacterium]|nr:tail fiber domain-containing protein [Ignavibacteriaceae bacterium]
MGNSSINYAGIQVSWTVTSDRRWKENVQPTNLGLNFISELNPVSYTRKNDENQKTEYGLIAQEVEQILEE